jgi:hypothetical protein
MARNRANRASANNDRAQAMTSAATATVARIRRRYREFLTDSRSLLDRPALAECSEQLVSQFVGAYDNAVEALGQCTPTHSTRQAARALATAHAAEYAAALADQHVRRMARHGIYPYRTGPMDARGLDQVEEAHASLELAAQTPSPALAASHRRRAAELTAATGIGVPDLLAPAWHALLDEPAARAAHVA